MLDTLITTKIRIPRERPNLVLRPRLSEKLERDAGRRLTVISAPAGFGKTTLLGEWLGGFAGGERNVAWVSLDEGDNDPARFLSYLVAALGTVREGIGEGVLTALRSPEPPHVEAMVGALINDLAALPGELTLVLDDYHVIDAQPIHEIVSFLLERLPPNTHLVISSRIDPPLPLARLRARGQMAELDATDLSFTREEAATFLKDAMGLELRAEDIATLEERTEGWITGLQLAALSMRDREDVSGFVGAFSGSHRDVLDFLAEEVLREQPEGVRTFLLETSVLEHLTGELGDALTGRLDGQQMVERLEQENLFLIPLDDERRWYRYHHLFADFLRGRLERVHPERVPELHRRAAAWYEHAGLISEAVGHALSAEDHERAAQLVERVVGETWFRGEVLTLLGWLEALPERAKRRRPRLLLEHAMALLWVGRLDDVEPLLREAERVADVGDPPSETNEVHRRYLSGYAAAIRSWRARLQGDWPGAIELARRALALLPDDPAPRSFAFLCLGTAYGNADDLLAASQAFAEAAELGRAAGNIVVAMSAMGYYAELQMARGRLREADDVLQRALGFATERGDASLPAAGWVPVAMGELRYEWNDLDSARHRLTEGMELAERTGEVGTLVDGHVALSRVERARGDADGALKTAEEADRLAQSSGVGPLIVKTAVQKARLYLAQGDLAAATFEQERAEGVGGVPPSARETERIALARLLIARGEHDEALLLLTSLRETAEAAGRTGNVIEILALETLALQAKGDKERAVSTLAQALSLAEPEGYVRTFVDEGPNMGALLSEVLEARQKGRLAFDVPAYYLRKLLAALEREAAASIAAEQLAEPLSEREREVLALVAAGKSNRQIAQELFVAQSTVKTHINNIYRKLEARSRTQALVRARELNLI